MLKKVLICVFSVLLVLILITGALRFAVNICDAYLVSDSSAATEENIRNAKNRTVEYLFAVDPAGSSVSSPTSPLRSSYSGSSGFSSTPAAYAVVIGTLVNEDKYYYTIYSKSGEKKAYGEFGESTENCTIQDIRTNQNEINILCEENARCVLYTISLSERVGGGSMKIEKKLEFNPYMDIENVTKMLLPDDKMEYIIAAGVSSAVLYNVSGQAIQTYYYEPKNLVTSGIYHDSTLVLCGAVSSEADGSGFSYGFAEAFSEDGQSQWFKKLFNKGDYISAAMECQLKPNGDILIYGRYFDYSESDFVMTSLDVDRYDDLKIYGNGSDYFIYTQKIKNDEGGAVQSSAFIAELGMQQGNEINMKAYSALNDYKVPSISQEGSLNKLNKNGDFILTLAYTQVPDKGKYFLNIDGTHITVPNNIKVFFDVDSNGGIYVYIAENGTGIYKMKYFDSINGFASGMKKLSKALTVSHYIDRLPVILPWFLISVAGVILLAAKHYWRYDRKNEQTD